MKNSYESKEHPFKDVPKENASDSEVWNYSLSFNAYTWVEDMHAEKKLKPLLLQEEIDFLNTNHGSNWENEEVNSVMLAGCIGAGKSVEELSVEELRTVLFMENRAFHWANWDEEEEKEYYPSTLETMRDIIEEIRKKLK